MQEPEMFLKAAIERSRGGRMKMRSQMRKFGRTSACSIQSPHRMKAPVGRGFVQLSKSALVSRYVLLKGWTQESLLMS